MANGKRPSLGERVGSAAEGLKASAFWESMFRPGSPLKKGYSDSPRNRSYVIMNNVLYHLHPVKVKRHGVRLSYTLCLGGLSFFLFILLTITGIFLMFYYRPTVPAAYIDVEALSTSVAFGSLVRNLHRWGAHLMVLTVFLHMSRVFYHGAYKPPASSTGSSESCCCFSRCSCRSPATSCPGISLRCGLSPSVATWPDLRL